MKSLGYIITAKALNHHSSKVWRNLHSSYRTVVLLTDFYQRNTFVYSLNVLNFKGMSSVNTSLSLKHLKHCHFVCMKVYSSWWESCDKYSTGFALCYIYHSTLTLSCIFHTNWRQCFKYIIQMKFWGMVYHLIYVELLTSQIFGNLV